MDQSMQGAVRRGGVLSLVQRSVRRRDYGLRRGDRDLGRLRFAPGRRSLAQAETDQTGALVLTAGRGRIEVRRRDGGAPVATVEGGRRPVMAIRTAQGPVYGWRRSGRVFLAFGATWGMPLLFVISGIGSWYSLGSRSAAEFARERLRRLGVPLLVGLLTLVPLQVYLGRRRAGDTSSYADFSARFWDVRPSLEFPFVVRADPAGGLFETGHLWFLVCLLGFSLVLLPGLVLLGRPPGRRLIERLAGLLARPGGLLLPVLPLAAVEVLRGSETGHGGWNDASYALFLVYGCLAAADHVVQFPGDPNPLLQHRPAGVDLPLLVELAVAERRRMGLGGGHPGAGRQPGRPTRDSAPLGPGAPPGRLGQRRRAGLLRAPPGGPISLRPEAHPGYHRPMTTAMRRFGCPPARCGLAGAFGMA